MANESKWPNYRRPEAMAVDKQLALVSDLLGGTDRYLTHLATDKPIYREGEKVYVRGTILHAFTNAPFSDNREEIDQLGEQINALQRANDDANRPAIRDLAQQQQVLEAAKNGDSLIVLTTNVAETSLTIEGVTHVIDTGLAREPVYDPARHRSRLVTRRSSEASARQRSGRAGITRLASFLAFKPSLMKHSKRRQMVIAKRMTHLRRKAGQSMRLTKAQMRRGQACGQTIPFNSSAP